MKGFAFSHRGFIDICAKELREQGAHVVGWDENAVEFEADETVICALIYRCQSPVRFIVDGVCGKAETIEEIISLAKKISVEQWLPGMKTFRVAAMSDNCTIPARVVMKNVADALDVNLEVDLNHPDLTIFTHIIRGKAYIGIDVVPFDISKRTYKIFHAASSIKGTLAYCLVRWSGCHGESLLDPCSGVGVIPIEAALFFSRRSPHFFKKDALNLSRFSPFKRVDVGKVYAEFDNRITAISGPIFCFDRLLPLVKAAQKNAKIAGVEKMLATKKCDIDWMDTEIGEGEISYIVTQPPAFAQNSESEKKFHEMFFYQADYVMKEKGIIVLLCENIPVKEAESRHFALLEERTIYSGKQEFKAAKFQKV